MERIDFNSIKGFRTGSYEDEAARTGVTVIIAENGARGGVDISGGGPATRETPLLSPLTADNPMNAVVLSGGSAFGLAASNGVMEYLEARGMGYDSGDAIIPLVAQACIYDLSVGRSDVRPDARMGFAACLESEKRAQRSGPIGAGCGATVAKMTAVENYQRSGLGVYAARLGDLEIGAVAVVNSFGDIFDPDTHEKIRGMRGGSTVRALYDLTVPTDLISKNPLGNTNTTISCIITNGDFTKAEMSKIASMARAAYARCIAPVGTMADGDTIFALSSGHVRTDINVAGTLAAEVLAYAIREAVTWY